jgi:hypothetical protein
LQLISIALVRRLINQMDRPDGPGPILPYLTLMPIGWYLVKFATTVQGSDSTETMQNLVMVFDNEEDAYRQFIAHLQVANIDAFIDEDITLKTHEDLAETVAGWHDRFFGDIEQRIGADQLTNLFHIARHIAQDDLRTAPRFFRFEERDHHNLDLIAQEIIDKALGRIAEDQMLQAEYVRTDRYWHIIYPSYLLFKTQYDACVNRLLLNPNGTSAPSVVTSSEYHEGEPSEELKKQVKERDGYRCLCCGSTTKRYLQIDHIAPQYFGGRNALANLQTLCGICNSHKSISEINFRNHCTLETTPPAEFPELPLPTIGYADEKEHWELFLRRSINFFYRCAAVSEITIKSRGQYFWNWEIDLYQGNDPAWLEPHLHALLMDIRARRQEADRDGPDTITVSGPDTPAVEARALVSAW